MSNSYLVRENNNIDIYNDKVQSKLLLMSDIHYNNNFNYKKLEMINNLLEENNPDYLLVCGDMFDESSNINIDNLIKWFESINKYVSIIFSLGNHDTMYKENGKWVQGTKEYICYLKMIKNAVVLDNSNFRESGINFIGFNNSFDYYEKYREDKSIFLQEILEFFSNIEKLNENDFNILMCHSPYSLQMINHLKDIGYFKSIDLIVSGHMHGGLVPPIMKRYIEEPKGIIAPNKKLFPEHARGVVYNDGIPNIISEGVTKLAGMKLIDSLYSVDYKNIKLIKRK